MKAPLAKNNSWLTVKVTLCFMYITILGGLSSCSQDKLSRSNAEKILQEHEKFPIPVIFQLPLFVAGNMEIPEEYKQFQQLGLITYEYTPQKGWDLDILKATMTNDGTKYAVAEPYVTNQYSGATAVDVKGCEKKFLKVTGIAPVETGMKGAQVEYEWTYDNLTPFSIIARSSDSSCREPGKVQKSSVMFILYDDGWRIQE